MAKVTSVDPEGQWAWSIPAGRAAFTVRTLKLIIYFFLVGGGFLPGFWAALFSGANPQDLSIPLECKNIFPSL